jgi:hypothetical protein
MYAFWVLAKHGEPWDDMGKQDKSRIDIGRLQRLSSAFGSYTVDGLTESTTALAPVNGQPVMDPTTKEALKLIFTREGSYAQVCRDFL